MRVYLSKLNGDRTAAQEIAAKLSNRQRLVRVVKGGGATAIMTLFVLPIPGLHFVLVPLFLLATVWIAVKRWRSNFVVQLDAVRCPECVQELKCGAVHFGRDGGVVYCGQCRARVVVAIGCE